MPATRASIESELKDLAFAEGCAEDVVGELAKLCTKNVYSAGSEIFRESELCDRIHLILRGRVALEMSVPARGRIRLLTLSDGDLLGWSPLVGNGQMTATALALEETQVLSMAGSSLLALCESRPEVGYVIMQRLAWALSRRLTATRLQLLDLYSHTPPAVVPWATEGGKS